MPENCILLETTSGYRRTRKIPLAPKSYVTETLLKGSLLVELTDAEVRETNFPVPLNYKKYFDYTVKLYCMPNQVRQLNDEQFKLLLGVKYSFDRYKVINILDWAEDLKVGYDVNVTIPANTDPVKGVVRYIGSLPGEEGTKFGIELLEKRGEGTSDGTLKNTKYFKCDHGCAVFVAMDKLSEPNSFATSDQVHEIVGPQDTLLKLDDRVIIYDQKDNPVYGIVRWIGMNRAIRQLDGSKIVGIETDQQIMPQSIPGSVRKMNHMFTVNNKSGGQIFLPIGGVLKDEFNSPTATNSPSHSCTRSKDEHDSPDEVISKPSQQKEVMNEAEVLLVPEGEVKVLPTPCKPDEPDTQTHASLS